MLRYDEAPFDSSRAHWNDIAHPDDYGGTGLG